MCVMINHCMCLDPMVISVPVSVSTFIFDIMSLVLIQSDWFVCSYNTVFILFPSETSLYHKYKVADILKLCKIDLWKQIAKLKCMVMHVLDCNACIKDATVELRRTWLFRTLQIFPSPLIIFSFYLSWKKWESK